MMLDQVDLSQSLEDEGYEAALKRYQKALKKLSRQVYFKERPVIIVFEGWPASGKGNAIRTLSQKLDPRGYAVYAMGPADGDDALFHYLRRFWMRVPETGRIAIFDRSWYSRVLGERVEGVRNEDEWKRAYREINHFERQLVEFGCVVSKFWMHLSREEQARREEERRERVILDWKRSRWELHSQENWAEYETAVDEMLLRTDNVNAPWTVIASDCDRFARAKVLETVVKQLSQALDYDPFRKKKKRKKKKKSKKSKKS